MNSIEKLSQYFKKFPGIGERQARRFVYFLLNEKPADVKEFIQNIAELKKSVRQCASCFRFAELKNNLCSWCQNHQDAKILVVVEKEADLETLQKNELLAKYFTLGNPPRQKELIDKIKKENITEIILAFSLTPQSEHTEMILRQTLAPIISEKKIKISSLGRGLSTGLELEYSDPDTLQNALKNRN